MAITDSFRSNPQFFIVRNNYAPQTYLKIKWQPVSSLVIEDVFKCLEIWKFVERFFIVLCTLYSYYQDTNVYFTHTRTIHNLQWIAKFYIFRRENKPFWAKWVLSVLAFVPGNDYSPFFHDLSCANRKNDITYIMVIVVIVTISQKWDNFNFKIFMFYSLHINRTRIPRIWHNESVRNGRQENLLKISKKKEEERAAHLESEFIKSS